MSGHCGRLKLALVRSPPRPCQDWGNCKANLFLTLLDESNKELCRRNLYGTYRRKDYEHGPNPPPLMLNSSDEIVSLAKPGTVFQMEYTVGHGGGHTIEVSGWECNLGPKESLMTFLRQSVFSDFRHFMILEIPEVQSA